VADILARRAGFAKQLCREQPGCEAEGGSLGKQRVADCKTGT